jgi:hypothetical protein
VGKREIVCDLESQKGRKVWLSSRIIIGELRKLHFLETGPNVLGTEEQLAEMYGIYAKFIPSWEFEDGDGHRLPDPKDDLMVFNALTSDELLWLQGQIWTTEKNS